MRLVSPVKYPNTNYGTAAVGRFVQRAERDRTLEGGVLGMCREREAVKVVIYLSLTDFANEASIVVPCAPRTVGRILECTCTATHDSKLA